MGLWLAYWFADHIAVWLVWVKVRGLVAVHVWGNYGCCGVNTGARIDYCGEDGRLDGWKDRGREGKCKL